MTLRALTLLVALIVLQGAPTRAHEVGYKTGMVWVYPGGIICDTEEQAKQAIDTATPLSAGCGRLLRQLPVFIEAISEYEFDDVAYMILKITFLPPTSLGVQYGWEKHSRALDITNGVTV